MKIVAWNICRRNEEIRTHRTRHQRTRTLLAFVAQQRVADRLSMLARIAREQFHPRRLAWSTKVVVIANASPEFAQKSSG